MAPTGGANGLGTLYKIRRMHNPGAWNFKVIHTFTGGADGSTGSAGRMIVRHGHLLWCGHHWRYVWKRESVSELTPRVVGEWHYKTIYSFRGQPDGVFPYGALLFDHSGNNPTVTTYYGGD